MKKNNEAANYTTQQTLIYYVLKNRWDKFSFPRKAEATSKNKTQHIKFECQKILLLSVFFAQY